ncbi:hypothetical protein HDV03_000283 [Kappamyces sp. JEL0829]|nr:hypothetical protein HDV03_000283 [Kappamyces sp. JEL0829]KAJ3370415.1 hypothetical protein HDU91_006269 [Kappamyces sp. JEL0680]
MTIRTVLDNLATTKFSNRKFTRVFQFIVSLILCSSAILYLSQQTLTNGSNDAPTRLDYSPRLRKDNTDAPNQKRVRDMLKRTWDSYKQYAWGADELQPLSNNPRNWSDVSYLFTPVDALDTLYIAGLTAEYQEAKALVLERLDIDQPSDASHNHFEIAIRVLGGLLSANELDPHPEYVKKATALADRLLVPFSNHAGMPPQRFNIRTGEPTSTMACLASVGTLQLELQYLSDLTGNPKYQQKALAIYDTLQTMNQGLDKIPGLYPSSLNVLQPSFANNEYTVGAEADSFYEYLLKIWISTKEEKFRTMYDQSAKMIMEHLVKRNENTTFFAKKYGQWGALEDKFSHLGCFAAGMFSLGAMTQQTSPEWKKYFDVGSQVTETCYRGYLASGTGLGVEQWNVAADGSISVDDSRYLLRPEVIESIFYHYRFTHDPKYREWGVAILDALEANSKTPTAYAALQNGARIDNMESFFLAETLKYLYLLFSSDSLIPLDEYVFNTEAHPVAVRGRGLRSDPKKWVPIK